MNVISCKKKVNNFIPFSESEAEVDSKDKFASNFMYQYINGKYKLENNNSNLLNSNLKNNSIPIQKIKFSLEAQNVFESGKELFKYYHSQKILMLMHHIMILYPIFVV